MSRAVSKILSFQVYAIIIRWELKNLEVLLAIFCLFPLKVARGHADSGWEKSLTPDP